MSAAHDSRRVSDRHAAARIYADAGLYVFPARVAVEIDKDGEPKKKINTIVEWQKVATRDKSKIDFWWHGSWSDASVAIATGPSGLNVVDCDGPDGLAEWQKICDDYGIPHGDHELVAPHYRTPGGGEHWWYRCDLGGNRTLPTKSRTVGDHIDSRGGWIDEGSGFVIVPPSTDDRGAYEWITDAPGDIGNEVPRTPEAVFAIVEERATRKQPERNEAPRVYDGDRRFTLAQAKEFCRPALDALKEAGKYQINDALNTAARTVAHFGGEFWTREQAEKRLMRLQLRAWHDGDERAARGTIESAYRAQAEAYSSGAVDDDGRPTGWYATYVEPSPLGDDEESGEYDEALEERLLEREVETQRRRLKARRIVSAEDREDLRVLDGIDFLAGEELEYLVPGMLYRSSTAKVFGPPGGTKSFLALDLALCIATGKPWRGRELDRVRVHYVMAEGESVNRLRTRAWLKDRDARKELLAGRFTAIPQGVLLTPEGIEEYLEVVRRERPGLVILDTKNAMMDGNENDASDVGVMIRAMRAIRDAGQRCCVVLVDHTGLFDASRGRGSNAVTAAMDTEIRVSRDRDTGIATAEVTRDKASEPGKSWSYQLFPVNIEDCKEGIAMPAVCKPVELPESVDEDAEKKAELPDDVLRFPVTKSGSQDIEEIARLLKTHGSGATGVSRSEIIKYFRDAHPEISAKQASAAHKRVSRAWDALYELGRIQGVTGKSKITHHRWVEEPGKASNVDDH